MTAFEGRCIKVFRSSYSGIHKKGLLNNTATRCGVIEKVSLAVFK